MQTQSDSPSTIHSVQEVSRMLSVVGWLSVWLQITFVFVAAVGLLFAFTGQNYALNTLPTTGIGIGTFWAVLSVLALLVSILISFRYTRTAKRLKTTASNIPIPSKASTVQLLRVGIITGIIGMLLALLGSGSTLGVLIAKTISQPPGVAITNPNRIVRALDVFVMMSNLVALTAHFIGTVSTLWLSDRVSRR